MGLKEKLATAAPTTWPAEGISEEEVRRIVKDAKVGPGVDVDADMKVAELNARLNEIAGLKDNWNGYGAKAFSKELVEYCRGIVNELAAESFIARLFIALTACDSIQFEYEKDNGDYLEFNIIEDHIEIYSDTEKGGEIENVWDGDDGVSWIKEAVGRFYGK